ncbi:hypothetical protein G7Y89_g14103 [Cudoniella acicularis]|uniref:BTB domain-containing protein n=1 Tax=Cudoniella acicularis TaxID=354080 RepID=A0A8H4R8F0_9HELO|nr:hypothetical protein G7Y89_g14103 [Cudoniella acicularis]
MVLNVPYATNLVTLIVRPDKTCILDPKVFLGYYSNFFESTIYGGFEESVKEEVHLPEEKEATVLTFIKWLYTGHVACHEILGSGESDETDTTLEQLWLFSDRFLAPKFFNDVLTELSLYLFTGVGSNLRCYVKDKICLEGPLHKMCGFTSGPWYEKWMAVLAKGGDFVTDCVAVGFAHYQDGEEGRPFTLEKAKGYFQKVEKVSPQEWLSKRQISWGQLHVLSSLDHGSNLEDYRGMKDTRITMFLRTRLKDGRMNRCTKSSECGTDTDSRETIM